MEGSREGVRWPHLVPIPDGPDLELASRPLLRRLDERVDVAAFERELVEMVVPPARRFGASKVRPGAVSRRALVKAEGARYRTGASGRGST